MDFFENIKKKINKVTEKVFAVVSLSYSWLSYGENNYKNAQSEYQERMELLRKPEVQLKLSKTREIIGTVEGRRLDDQQIYSIAYPKHSDLVLAGAGAGKTTTIIGKVKYLLATNQATPQNLLLLSFTNASATEMKERVRKETGQSIYVATFHKLALDIIKRVNKIAPKIYSSSLSDFAKDSIKKNMNDPKFSEILIHHLMHEQLPDKSDLSFSNQAEYYEYLELYPPVTFKNEKVKSYGEVCIANFLTEYGINYIYENEYEYDTRDADHLQYKPDFYLPDYGYYIEYFGINRKGEVPAYFKSDDDSPSNSYKQSMKWKRSIHKQYNTELIETYAYEHLEGNLEEELKENLIKLGVILKKQSIDKLLEKQKESENKTIISLADTVSTIILLAKAKHIISDDLVDMAIKYTPKRLDIAKIAEYVYRDYDDYLKASGNIDFVDMLLLAEQYIMDGLFVNKFQYIIIDEYQDISAAQYRLLKAMRKQLDYDLYCVGDDWQSIYRFAGSDINYILDFKKYWEDSSIKYIEKTYRFPEELINITGKFIMSNPKQFRKKISSDNNTIVPALGIVEGYTDKYAVEFLTDKLNDIPKNKTVFLIGRYSFDVEVLKLSSKFSFHYNTEKQRTEIKLSGRPDLNICFYTAHKSKGFQADYVVIINNKKGMLGFPSKIQNPPLVEHLLEQKDDFPDAEERRLFYVAMTRAKEKVILMTVKNQESVFVNELLQSYGKLIRNEKYTCPLCGGKLIKRSGKYGDFFGCDNYKDTGCRYIKNISLNNK